MNGRSNEIAAGKRGMATSPGLGVSVAEIFFVVAPFAAVAAFRDYWDFTYKGPLAIVLGAVVATWLLHRRGQRWRDLGLCRPDDWGKVALGVILTLAVAFAAQFLVAQPIINATRLVQPDLSALAVVRESPMTLMIFIGPLSWGSAAFGEEFVARGFILNRLGTALGGTRAAWIAAALAQAVIFGLAHGWQGAAGIITTGIIGLVFGLAYLAIGRNLWLTILAHGLIDSVFIVTIYIGGVAAI